MAPGKIVDRPARLRKEEEDVEDEVLEAEDQGEASDSEDESRQEDSTSNQSSDLDEELTSKNESDTSPEDEPEETTELKEISFGALAQAQAALGPVSRKRKLVQTEHADDTSSTKVSRQEERRQPKEHASRTSKHAPAIQSSRRAVTRRLEVFEPSAALKSRDPRFDPLIQSSTAADPNANEKTNKNYSFLTLYQADELLALKSQLKKSKTPEDAAALKRQLMILQSKIQRAEALNKEKEILRKHKREEREAIKSGVKERPYYLKKSDVKREVLKTRFEGMSKKAREKAVERKRKRIKTKEGRSMPRVRRERE